MTVDVLAIAAHPDDIEMTCAGTVLSLVAQGKTVAGVDLTRGELGTRGTRAGSHGRGPNHGLGRQRKYGFPGCLFPE